MHGLCYGHYGPKFEGVPLAVDAEHMGQRFRREVTWSSAAGPDDGDGGFHFTTGPSLTSIKPCSFWDEAVIYN